MTYEEKRQIEKMIERLWDEDPMVPEIFPIAFTDNDESRRVILKSAGQFVGYAKYTAVADSLLVRWKSIEDAEGRELALAINDPATTLKSKKGSVAYTKYQIGMGIEFCRQLRRELR